jgi:hypothetical protein
MPHAASTGGSTISVPASPFGWRQDLGDLGHNRSRTVFQDNDLSHARNEVARSLGVMLLEENLRTGVMLT